MSRCDLFNPAQPAPLRLPSPFTPAARHWIPDTRVSNHRQNSHAASQRNPENPTNKTARLRPPKRLSCLNTDITNSVLAAVTSYPRTLIQVRASSIQSTRLYLAPLPCSCSSSLPVCFRAWGCFCQQQQQQRASTGLLPASPALRHTSLHVPALLFLDFYHGERAISSYNTCDVLPFHTPLSCSSRLVSHPAALPTSCVRLGWRKSISIRTSPSSHNYLPRRGQQRKKKNCKRCTDPSPRKTDCKSVIQECRSLS